MPRRDHISGDNNLDAHRDQRHRYLAVPPVGFRYRERGIITPEGTMKHRDWTAVISGAVILAGLIATPGQASAESCLHSLEGGRVVVTMRDGTVVRGWLIRVSPKELLIGCDNNTFVRANLGNVAKVRRASSTSGSHKQRSQPPECIPAPTVKPARAMPKPSARRWKALKLRARADRLRRIGMGLTIGGLCVGVVGTGVTAVGVAFLSTRLFASGLFIAIIGGLAALVGTPIWVVGSNRVRNASEQIKKYPTNLRPLDPFHERRMISSLRHGHPCAQVFGLRFRI